MGTLGDLVKRISRDFEAAKISSPRLDADLLIGFVLGKTREELIVANAETVSTVQEGKILELAKRRSNGEPVAYLVGMKSFFGLDFNVRPGVLVPRPETEHIVEEALQWLASKNQDSFTICDLGCGSGCIGIAVLHNSLNSTLTAADKSPIACEVTKENAEKFGLSDRVTVMNIPVEELNLPKVDLVLANPPYIAPSDKDLEPNVRKFEPAEALFSGPTGFEHIQNWKNVAAGLLLPGGLLIMEFGFKQGDRTKSIFESDPAYDFVRIGKDLSGNDRYIVATRQ